MSSLVNRITFYQEEKEFFWENGFIKLNRLLTREATDKLRDLTYNSQQITKAPEYYTGDFSRIGYGVENAVTHQIYSEENFKYTLKQLIENELTFTPGVGFELTPNKRGFYFHLDVASFSFIQAEDLAYSLWIPLVPINTKEQHGAAKPIIPSPEICAHTAKQFDGPFHQDNQEFQLVWEANRRLLDRLDPSYIDILPNK
ncbi:hypothetical protein [Planktothricoides raciborskii]|uniref:Uncharacterized protein n=1 Tax=Planktothricoides raciborskii FACHB-1370 TaxID=2949576 RepID=A0ABR8EFH3_9CYAN|nr:hypothetical protein [Planktothricoides raciborskii]MBD2544859.1 hypothetical protein [Planktothricoides raciborskii FACHB-1370]MBD2583045.1 hypothetical protein [Planktothricoides raciborskii FACHB-1261]